MRSFLSSTGGAALVEYGLLVGLVAVVAIGSVSALGQKTSETFSGTAGALASTSISSTSFAAPGAVSGPARPARPDASGCLLITDRGSYSYNGYDCFVLRGGNSDDAPFLRLDEVHADPSYTLVDGWARFVIGSASKDVIEIDTLNAQAAAGWSTVRSGSVADEVIVSGADAAEATFAYGTWGGWEHTLMMQVPGLDVAVYGLFTHAATGETTQMGSNVAMPVGAIHFDDRSLTLEEIEAKLRADDPAAPAFSYPLAPE